MIDKEVIEQKFDIIQKNLKFLEEFKTMSSKDFVKSYKNTQAAKYSLLEIVEACIDIANHIISTEGYERAEEYSEMFMFLQKEGVIGKSLCELSDMAKFRDLLVQRHGDIDNEMALDIIKSEDEMNENNLGILHADFQKTNAFNIYNTIPKSI